MDRPEPGEVEYIPSYAASAYATLAEEYGRAYYRTVAAAAADHLGDDAGRMLDAGTGPGILPVEIATQTTGVRIDAVDYTHELVTTGRERAHRRGVDARIAFIVADIYTLPVGEATYEFVTCTGVLHSLDDPEAALTELHRVLEPGGTAWVFDPAVLDLDGDVADHLTPHEQEVVEAYRDADSSMATYDRTEAERIVAATPFDPASIERGPDDDLRLYLRKPGRS